MLTLFFPENLEYDFSRGTCLALGNFDGLHIAHQDLIKKAVYIGENTNLISAVYTFSSHPKNFFRPRIKVLTPLEKKTHLIEEIGPDLLIYQNLTPDFLELEPEEFVKRYLVDYLHAKHVVVGKHYTFGRGSSGTSFLLKKLGAQYGFRVDVMDLITTNDGQVISSTNIRNFLQEGKVEEANILLGRHFSIGGEIESGNRIGNTIGFPTINIYAESNWLLPRYGVYVVKVWLDGNWYQGVANVGVKPTVNGTRPVIETNIFDHQEDWYGKKAEIIFYQFLRPEKKFSSLGELKRQIASDSKRARTILSQM